MTIRQWRLVKIVFPIVVPHNLYVLQLHRYMFHVMSTLDKCFCAPSHICFGLRVVRLNHIRVKNNPHMCRQATPRYVCCAGTVHLECYYYPFASSQCIQYCKITQKRWDILESQSWKPTCFHIFASGFSYITQGYICYILKNKAMHKYIMFRLQRSK